jgi:tetratricopeptide (TPR) repeat protein
VLTHLGRNAEAVERLRRSVELFRDAGIARGSGTAKTALGLVLLRLKRYDEAADVCREAIALCRSARELDSMRTAQVNLSYALLRAGRYQELIAASGDALATCEEINYEDGVTSMLANLAFACLKEKQYDESVRRHKQLLERLPRQDHTQRAKANDHIGFALVAIEDVVAGAKFYQEAADEYAAVRDYRNAGIACLDAGEVLVNANRSEESIVATGRAADLLAKSGDGENEARARVRLGQAYSLLERWDEGAKAFRDAASVSERCGDRAGRAFATTLLGGTLVDSGHPERALPYLEWAIEEGKRIENATVQRLASRFLGIAQVKLARGKGMGGSAS